MDNKLNHYRQIITDLLTYYYNLGGVADPNIEYEDQLLIDSNNDHYQILSIGWQGSRRIYAPICHIDIKHDKVWVQEDATDFNLVEQLEERGIPANDIVLAFHAPYQRADAVFALA